VKQDITKRIVEGPVFPVWFRFALAAALVILAGYSVFGILCSFEPNSWRETWAWRLGYAGAGLGCLAGAAKLVRRRRLRNS